MQRVKACSGPVCSVACPGPDQKRKEARPAQGQIQRPEQGLHRAREQQREVDVHQGPAQGQKVQDKVGLDQLRYQCQVGGYSPRSPNPTQSAPKRCSTFSRGAARRLPCSGLSCPPLLIGNSGGKQKSHMFTGCSCKLHTGEKR